MGQFYRVIIQEMAGMEYMLYTEPYAEFWEDVQPRVRAMNGSGKRKTPRENRLTADNDDGSAKPGSRTRNALLRDWGRSGRENIRLWCPPRITPLNSRETTRKRYAAAFRRARSSAGSKARKRPR